VSRHFVAPAAGGGTDLGICRRRGAHYGWGGPEHCEAKLDGASAVYAYVLRVDADDGHDRGYRSGLLVVKSPRESPCGAGRNWTCRLKATAEDQDGVRGGLSALDDDGNAVSGPRRPAGDSAGGYDDDLVGHSIDIGQRRVHGGRPDADSTTTSGTVAMGRPRH